MIKRQTSAALTILLATTACGGGGGGGGTVTTPPVAVVPTLGVSIAPATQTTAIDDLGNGTALGFAATVAGSTSDTVVADLKYDNWQLVLDGDVTRGTDGVYRVRFKPVAGLANGSYTGSATFRLCREAACNTVYPGSTQSFAYTLTLQLGDWATFQRNAAHTGFVRATFDPAAFRKAWEWAPTGVYGVSPIASSNGLVYVTARDPDGTAVLRALSSTTGEQRWNYAIGRTAYHSGPAVGNGRVFVTTMTTSSTENAIVSVNAVTGEFAPPNATFASQWADFLQPTPYKDGLYIAAGYYGNFAYGYNYSSYTAWATDTKGSIWDGQTPAVDEQTVYYYSGKAIELIDRQTGEIKGSLTDPFFQSSGYDYHGAPILGSTGNVMAYSGHRGPSSPSILVNWSIADKAYKWRSANTYSTTPAVGGGRIYLSKSTPGELNVLDEETGRLLWGWAPPVDERMIGNTILTETIVFVSTNKSIYAIPIQGSSHVPVWSAPGGGEMAITPDGMLIVTGQAPEYGYPRALTAYRLR